jgi:hypothetical protein
MVIANWSAAHLFRYICFGTFASVHSDNFTVAFRGPLKAAFQLIFDRDYFSDIRNSQEDDRRS